MHNNKQLFAYLVTTSLQWLTGDGQKRIPNDPVALPHCCHCSGFDAVLWLMDCMQLDDVFKEAHRARTVQQRRSRVVDKHAYEYRCGTCIVCQEINLRIK
jgi:hypothetical protein